MENNSPFSESPRGKTGKMRKTRSQTRHKYKDNNPHGNTLAADKRMREIERINNILKTYLKYYKNILKNKKKDEAFNRKLLPILDQIFSEIQAKGILNSEENLDDEDLDDYIERLTEYIDTIGDYVDSDNSQSRNALKNFATIQAVLNRHSKRVSNVFNSKNKADNSLDELAGLFGRSTTLGDKKGGTRKLRKH